jgi:hypothetical protein
LEWACADSARIILSGEQFGYVIAKGKNPTPSADRRSLGGPAAEVFRRSDATEWHGFDVRHATPGYRS